jgi:DnaJ-class molecular chaperone
MSPPPVVDDEAVTVDEAWEIFGFPMKRGAHDDVKRSYTAFLAAWHPDKHQDGDPVEAERQFKRAQEAFALLKRHCKWP